MKRLWIPNFAFEYELNSVGFQCSKKLLEIQRPLITKLIPLMQADDGIWLAEQFPEGKNAEISELFQAAGIKPVWSESDLPAALEVIPWGWTSQILQWANRNNWETKAPRLTAVRSANSRKTSCELEQLWNCGPAEIFCFSQITSLLDHLPKIPVGMRWVIKAEFGMSSRERILGQGSQLNPSQLSWITKRLQQSQHLVWEPWLDKVSESSFHYQLETDGTVRYLGQVGLLTDVYGRYLQNQQLLSHSTQIDKSTLVDNQFTEESDWSCSRRLTTRAANFLAEQGYFGPLGIDSMIYRTPAGQIVERPLQDINARWTMGRIEWELAIKK